MRNKNTILEKNQNILGLLNLQYISNSSMIFKFPVSGASLYIANNVDGFRNVNMIIGLVIRVISISLRYANYGFFNIQVANHAAVSVFYMKNMLLPYYLFDFYCNFFFLLQKYAISKL